MIITEVRFEEEKNVFLVEFENGETLRLSYEIYEKFQIAPKKDLTEADITSLKAEDAYTRARAVALRSINYRVRSRGEIERTLIGTGFDEDTRERVIENLKKLHLLDDASYAETFTRDKIRLSNYGPIRIRALLRERGIENAAIEDTLANIEEDVFINAAHRAVDKKRRTLEKLDPIKRKQKIYELLSYRGFPSDMIRMILEDHDV